MPSHPDRVRRNYEDVRVGDTVVLRPPGTRPCPHRWPRYDPIQNVTTCLVCGETQDGGISPITGMYP